MSVWHLFYSFLISRAHSNTRRSARALIDTLSGVKQAGLLAMSPRANPEFPIQTQQNVRRTSTRRIYNFKRTLESFHESKINIDSKRSKTQQLSL